MNIHFTYKLSKTPDLEHAIQQQIEKLRKRLQIFRTDLVSLYGTIDEGVKTGVMVSLNLRLPSGQLAAQSAAEHEQAAVKSAFDDLIEQLAKHKDLLRSQHKWPNRRRAGRARLEPQVAFEDTFASVKADTISGQDVTEYVNLSLPRLQRFIERELRFRFDNGQLRSDQLSAEEVLDEAIAHALDDTIERPERVALEAWLHRLALRAIDRLANQTREQSGSVALESQNRAARTGVDGNDEPMLQFHQPDEMLTNENVIADLRTATPEDVAASDEIVAMVEIALRDARRDDREAFILFTMEGFTMREISVITQRKHEEVRLSIAAARDHLRKHFPVPGRLKDRLVTQTKTA